MATTLPVPIEFRLPEGWQPAQPDEVGAQGVAFVALHPQPDEGFTANITIDGDFQTDATPLAEVADDSVGRLGEVADGVLLSDRSEIGSDAAPGLTQTLTFTAMAGGERRDLVQSQVYLSVLDVNDSDKRAVIRLVLTVTTAQYDTVLEEFREFVGSVRPATGT